MQDDSQALKDAATTYTLLSALRSPLPNLRCSHPTPPVVVGHLVLADASLVGVVQSLDFSVARFRDVARFESRIVDVAAEIDNVMCRAVV
jgi:hypothetical protein